MEIHKVYIKGSGGNLGISNPIYMGVTDFCIVLDGKEYHFSANEHRELCFMCINEVDEKIDGHDGYKRVNITNQFVNNDKGICLLTGKILKIHLSTINTKIKKGNVINNISFFYYYCPL